MKNYIRSTAKLRYLLPAGVLLLACGFGSAVHAATQGQAAPPPTSATVDGGPVTTEVRHVQSREITPAERTPHIENDPRLRVDYDNQRQHPTQSQSSRLRSMAINATCEVDDFAAASGSALVDLVKSVEVTCLNNLYDLKGNVGAQVFPESKMVTIANAMAAEAASYPGDNTTQMMQLITFLRAGYYVEYSYSAAVGPYGSALKDAIRPALNAFIANPHFNDVSSVHGGILFEFVILIDSAEEQARQLEALKTLLANYDPATHDPISNMRRATNQVFTAIYLGHYRDGFKAAVIADTSIIDSLTAFTNKAADKVGTSNEYLLINSTSEMARFVQYTELRTKVRPLIKDLLVQFPFQDPTTPIYISVADMADWYDSGNCTYYDICDFKDDLAAMVLPIEHSCDASVHVRAQKLTSGQLAEVCSIVLAQTNYFHNVAKTNQIPVADDYNTQLEMVIFDSDADYKKYAGTLFNIDTNNGGMYLEGSPWIEGNLPRFIAFRADWLPDFHIWNLTHEYVHYLDGRYNMYGDFGATQTTPTIWWTEGFAEYVSYGYRNTLYAGAVTAAGAGTYPLSTIFYNTYNSGSDRVYSWGYLAIRYMFERHPGQVDNMLGLFRTGKYNDYASYLSSIKFDNDADWAPWLTCFSVNNGDSSTCGEPLVEPPMDVVLKNDIAVGGVSGVAGVEQMYTLIVPADATSLTLRTLGGSGNVSLYVQKDGAPTTTSYSHKSARPGNNESITIAKPEAGTYYMLVVGETAFSGVTVHARYKAAPLPPLPPSLPECTASDVRVFEGTCQRSGLADIVKADRYVTNSFYYYVPANTKKIVIQSMGGTGNADLYAGANWPTVTSYDHKSTGPDNNEQIVLDNPAAGWLYFGLSAEEAYQDVQVRLTVTPNTP